MDSAIWMILYDLAEQRRDDYLSWLHDVHVPEKLARPGYTWAAHYETVTADGDGVSLDGTPGQAGYVALFGGEDTSVFLNPSPAQIKPRQTDLTREMMGLRIASRSFIAAQEWRVESDGNDGQQAHPAMELICCDVGEYDEDFGAWCVQDAVSHQSRTQRFRFGCKLLAAVGPTKHVLMTSYSSMALLRDQRASTLAGEWTSRVDRYQSHMPGSPILGQRIWPPC